MIPRECLMMRPQWPKNGQPAFFEHDLFWQQIEPERVAFEQNRVSAPSQGAFPKILRKSISERENGLQREIRTYSPRDRVHQQ